MVEVVSQRIQQTNKGLKRGIHGTETMEFIQKYCCVALSDKWWTLPWFGFSIVFVSSRIIIAFIANDLYFVGYLCVLGILYHLSVLMAGLLYSRTSSTLVAPPPSRVFTLGSLGVSG